ncbi:MAG: hypothetical protein KGI41_00820 [Patescibacteria group bacterium]|nr:hypothetical protein [Patescibacteria group bacterium]MDE1965771.1 hypothetical protein [Patescibacteria group bacterium]
MTDSTVFIAQMMGPILFAVGIGVLVSKDYYLDVYRNLKNETLAVLTAGIIATAAGIVLVLNHNTWMTLPEMLVSLFGWIVLIKGLVLLVFPKAMERVGANFAKAGYMNACGVVVLVVGAYLTWFAYLVG